LKRESYSWTIFGVKYSGGDCRVRGDASMADDVLRMLRWTELSKLRRRDAVDPKRYGGDSVAMVDTVCGAGSGSGLTVRT
jgi:hypothetical protein